jgi:hypothetical protein
MPSDAGEAVALRLIMFLTHQRGDLSPAPFDNGHLGEFDWDGLIKSYEKRRKKE